MFAGTLRHLWCFSLETCWCVDAVINHIAKLISQQSDALDRWEKKTCAHTENEYTCSHTHTHSTVCSSVLKFLLCSFSLLLPAGEVSRESKRKKISHGHLFFWRGGGRERWGGLDMMAVRGVSLWLLPSLPAVGSEAGEYWRHHCQHVYIATVLACQRRLSLTRYKDK